MYLGNSSHNNIFWYKDKLNFFVVSKLGRRILEACNFVCPPSFNQVAEFNYYCGIVYNNSKQIFSNVMP